MIQYEFINIFSFSRLNRDIIFSQRNIKIFKLGILIPFYNSFFLFWKINLEEENTFSERLRRNNKEFKNGLEWFDCMLTLLKMILLFLLF